MLGKTDGSVHVWFQRLDKREIIAFLFRRRIIMIGWRVIIDFEIGDGEGEVERIGRVGGGRQFIGGGRSDIGGELCLLAGEKTDCRT